MRKIVFSVGGMVAALLFVEVVLRVFDVARPPELPPRPARPDIIQADPAVGYRLWPSTRSCMRYPPRTHRVSHVISNSDGFPSSRELGEPDARPRVLVLGDSFTFGLGVDEGSRFTEVVEELEPRWRVDNLGMVGYGIDLMVRSLERYGTKASPNAVVLTVYTDNFRRVHPFYVGSGSAFVKFALHNGRLVDVPYPARTSDWRSLRSVELVRKRLERSDENFLGLNEALLDRYHSETRRLGASPAIVFFPSRSDTDADRERRTVLRRWAAARGVAFRDLTTVFHDASARTSEIYLADRAHWNERGHRLAGEALHAMLASEVLRDAGAGIDTRTLPAPPWRRRWSYCHDAGGEHGARR